MIINVNMLTSFYIVKVIRNMFTNDLYSCNFIYSIFSKSNEL